MSTFVVNSHIKNHPTNQQLMKINEANKTEVYKVDTLEEPNSDITPIDINLLKNYIKFARDRCHPTLSNQNSELLK